MNCKEQISDTPSFSTKTYYAPAASTRGNKVIVYRSSLLRLCEQYHREACAARSELAAAKIRLRWAMFLLDQLPHYSGDRSDLYNFACDMGIYAARVIYYARAAEQYRHCGRDPKRIKRFRSKVCPDALLNEITTFSHRTGRDILSD
ncbi:MAG: hypothetical protein IJ998_00340 [Alistipes sp.]|nr:hypothetical protein [Alistipes sp.]